MKKPSARARESLGLAYVPLASLKRWPRNPKRHALDGIAASIQEFGMRDPLAVNRKTGELEEGHGRVDALQALKAQGKPAPRFVAVDQAGAWHVPVMHFDDDRATQERYGLAHNRTQELGGGYDEATLARVLADLAADQGLTGTGWDADDVDDLLRRVAATSGGPQDPGAQIERAVELQKQWKTKPGQLWQAGKHRLLCGDATKAQDVARLLDGAVPGLCVTDPPYGVDYDPRWRNVEAAKGRLAYAARRIGVVPNDDRADWSAAWRLFPGDVLYSWHPAGATSLVHAAALQGSGFELRMQIIWAKSNFPIGRGDYHVRHEPCWYAVRKGKPARRTNDRTQTTLWEINLDRNVDGGHSTQKPLECMARPIRNHDIDTVYDPFLGSGTTLVAAEQLRRVGYAMELDPGYVAVSLERLQGLGLSPELVK